METTDEQIGKNVASIRNDQGLSQKEVADRMRALGWKWAQNTVWAVESGERSLKLAESEDLANIFAINTWMLTRTDDEFKTIRTGFQAQEALEMLLRANDTFTTLQKLYRQSAPRPLPTDQRDEFYEVIHTKVTIEQDGVMLRQKS